jgi:chemotaxis signal transduction protein
LAQTLVLRAGVEHFGLPLASVREVFDPSAEPIPIPAAPGWLIGMINHHGRVVPVVRLDRLLQVEAVDSGRQLVLVDLGEEPVAIQVDQIESIEEVRSEGPALRGRRRAWLRGKLLTLLEPDGLQHTIHELLTRSQP